MFVRFTGADAHLIPSLALEVQPGQILEVPDHVVLPPVYEPVDAGELGAVLVAIPVAAGEPKPKPKRAVKAKETSK